MLEAMLTEVFGQCPYCGSELETAVDTTGGDQDYYEDCQTCCAPIHMQVHLDIDGALLNIEFKREDEI